MLAVMRRSTTKVGKGTTSDDDDSDDGQRDGHGGHSPPALVHTRRRRPSAARSATRHLRLVSKDGPHVRHPLPAPASHSVPGHTSAVLASHCSPYYVTAAGESSEG